MADRTTGSTPPPSNPNRPAPSSEASELFNLLQQGGGAGSPNVSLPPTQKYGIFKVTKEMGDIASDPELTAAGITPPAGYVYVRNPNYVEKPNAGPIQKLDDGSIVRVNPDNTTSLILPAAPKAQTLDQQTVTANGQIFTIDPTDPNGNFRPRTPTTADEQDKANKVKQREQNQALNGHYATDDEILDFNTKLQKAGIDKQKANDDQRVSEANQRRLDADEARKAAMAPLDIEGKKASTAGTIATTQSTLGNLDIAQKKLPYDIAQAQATTAGTQMSTQLTQAQIDKYKQDLAQGKTPTVQTPPTGMSQWTRDPNTGAVTQGAMNPEWLAKTQSEIAARVGQIQTLANAKKAEVMGKVNGTTFTSDMALQEFNNWYDQNVQPQVGSLQAAQQAAQIEQQKAVMGMRGTAMTQALGAGDQSQRAYDSYVKTHAGPNFDNVMAQITSGKPMSQIDTRGTSTFEGPNVLDLVQQGTQNALKYIDPTMAQGAGAPPPSFQGIDIGSALARDKYMPAWLNGGAPPPPPPPGGAAPAAIAAPPAPPPPMASSGTMGAGNPWAGGNTPAPGTVWQNQAYMPGNYQYLT